MASSLSDDRREAWASRARGAEPDAEGRWRIGELMQSTGLSKELIHHYLRQGLVPRSDARGRYTEQQVRLLRLVRQLREDHNLPLDLIRTIFQSFEFDAAKLETLTFHESLSRRISRLADGGLVPAESLSAAQVAATAEVDAARVAEYVRESIITPFEEDGEQRFTAYDANVVALCERGLQLGIPLESFRIAASYVQVAVDLEAAGFFGSDERSGDAAGIFGDLFLRRELVNAFVQNMLYAAFHLHFRDSFASGSPSPLSLDQLIYQPSAVFVARHGLDEAIGTARERCTAAQGPEPWLQAAELLVHAARYHEAVFMLEESHKRWPEPPVRAALGRALVLAGDLERGSQQLSAPAVEQLDDPVVWIYRGLAEFNQAQAERRPEALVEHGAGILRLVDRGLSTASDAEPARRFESIMLGAALLCALPPVFGCHERGVERLDEIAAELAEPPPFDGGPPALADRLQINAAYLLYRALGPDGALSPPASRHAAADPGTTAAAQARREQLRTAICRLDPGCAFAAAAYLDHAPVAPSTPASP